MIEKETLELFRRLKPHYGEKIDRLWIAYTLGDRREKEAIEGLLHMMELKTLHKTPDDQTILLPPPPASTAKGQYHLGEILYNGKPLYPFGIPDENAIRMHTAIFGRSGAGKTNLLFHLLGGFIKEGKPKIWVLDWKRDYRPILQSTHAKDVIVFTVGRPVAPFKFNPLYPPPGSEREIESYHERLIDIIGRAFYVGHGVKSLLRKGLKAITTKWHQNPQENPLNFKVLWKWLVDHQGERPKSRRASDWMESTLRTIESLCLGEFGKGLNVQESLDLSALMQRNVIFELDALADDQRTFFAESLLLWLRQFLLNKLDTAEKNSLQLVLVVEEAHHILKTGREKVVSESILETTLRETRSLGMGLIIVDQSPSLIHRVAFSNTFTSIFFSLKGRADIRCAADALLLNRNQEEYLGRLDVGQAVVKCQGNWFDPFHIQVPHVPEKDLPVPDEEVRKRFKEIAGQLGSPSACSSLFQPEEAGMNVIRPPSVPERDKTDYITEIEQKFLQEILTNPLVGISKRYKNLGLSTRHGNELKDRLTARELIQVVEVATPTGRLKLLELTSTGENLLRRQGLLPSPIPRNGAGHRYWKEQAASLLRQQGYAVTIEKVVEDGKRVDVEGIKGDERLAIEVETGRSKSTSDFALVLRHYRKLIILVTDPLAEAKVNHVLQTLSPDEKTRTQVVRTKDLPMALTQVNKL